MDFEETYCGYCKEGEQNWNNEPRMVTDCDEMGVPICPSCGEWTYTGTRCPFCGQQFIRTKKKLATKAILNNAHWDKEGVLVCNQCGCKDIRFIGSYNGEVFYGNRYLCENCENAIDIEFNPESVVIFDLK